MEIFLYFVLKMVNYAADPIFLLFFIFQTPCCATKSPPSPRLSTLAAQFLTFLLLKSQLYFIILPIDFMALCQRGLIHPLQMPLKPQHHS